MILERRNMPFRRNIASEVIAAGITAAGSLAAGGASAAGQANLNKKNREFAKEQAAEQRAWSEKMYNEQNAWNYEMWQKENEYNTPAAQVQRMRDAGLNPLFYGLDGSSAGDLTAAQPLAYEQAKSQPTQNAIGAGMDTFAQMKGLENSTKLVNAQIDKLHEEQSGLKLDNDFKERTMNARVEAENLANSLTKEQIAKAGEEIKSIQQNIKESIARTENEIEKKGLILAEKTLKEAETKEVLELIPYKKNLMEAQTAAQKAAASASYMHALYEKGLIDAGYIDKMCEDLDASIKEKNARADSQDIMNGINEWKLSVKSGNAYDIDSIPWTRPTDKVAAYISNKLFQFASAASEAVGGGLSGFIK